MAKSYLLKSSIAKKYWMAATGLFLCTFLIGHLVGNLQLFVDGYQGKLQFNEYGVFMTTNPAIKLLSYVTYISILFHTIDGIMLTIQNRKARPVKYAHERADKNSNWASRNMALLGSLILIFIVLHMSAFWYVYKFGEAPYMKGDLANSYVLKKTSESVPDAVIKDGVIYYQDYEIGPAMKDLHEMVVVAFQELWIVALYVLAMIALAFHLSHGFSSAFQSLGLKHPSYNNMIKKTGLLFAVLIPFLFAIIPLYIHFK